MKKNYLYAAVAILLWSTIATISKLLLDSMNSYQVLMVSSAFATAILLVVALFNGRIKLLKSYRIKDYLITLLIGLPGTFAYYVFLYLGTERMAASQAFMINYLWPIMSIIFACIILGEKMSTRKWIAVGLSFLGVITIAGDDLISFNPETLLGVLLCALAAASYGAFTALNRKWNYDDGITVMLSYFATFLLTLLINLFMGEGLSLGGLEILGFAWNGIFTMGIATVAWALALKSGGTAKMSNLAYVTPFLSLVWTFFILDEPIKPLSVLGLVLIVSGIFIQMKKGKNETE